jgi:3-deoxy-D-manno-octulosonic-acid transferase
MVIFYWLGLRLYGWLVALAAFSNPKARLMRQGQRRAWAQIKAVFGQNTDPVAWFHCASLGEFEQGRPVIEGFRAAFPHYKILLTFFSSSGCEAQKHYAGADLVCYLPADSPGHARRLLDLVRPSIVFFVKYEFWHFYAREVARRHIPLVCFSAVFRPDQVYFKPWGGFFRRILHNFDHFFVQNERTEQLLRQLGLSQVALGGDTRFDRVLAIAGQPQPIPVVERFKAGQPLMVLGSTWPSDVAVVAPVLDQWPGPLRLVVAPHELPEAKLRETEAAFPHRKIIRFSQVGPATDLAAYDLLLIDNIGMLNQLYRYGEVAWVGGAFQQGLHNILEAAVHGVPVLFGNLNYHKAEEAHDLLAAGGAFAVANGQELAEVLGRLLAQADARAQAGAIASAYVRARAGATPKVLAYCQQVLGEAEAG